MKRSNRLVLLVGVFLAIVAFVGIAVILGGNGGGSATPSAATTLSTVIAVQDIPLGVVVKAEMLTKADKRIDTERKAGAFADPSLVIGQTTRRKITTGAQLEAADFIDTGATSQLAVPAGKVAIAIQVDQVSGVGTLIKTGDYVDMLLGLHGDTAFPVVTLNQQDSTVTVVQGINATSVKVALQGVQVVGTLLQAQPAAAEGAPAPSGQPSTTLTTGGLEMVIVAVDTQQAEVVKFAQLAGDGTISLTLRSAADFVDESGNPIVSAPAGTTGITLKTLVDLYGVIRPQLVEAILPAQ